MGLSPFQLEPESGGEITAEAAANHALKAFYDFSRSAIGAEDSEQLAELCTDSILQAVANISKVSILVEVETEHRILRIADRLAGSSLASFELPAQFSHLLKKLKTPRYFTNAEIEAAQIIPRFLVDGASEAAILPVLLENQSPYAILCVCYSKLSTAEIDLIKLYAHQLAVSFQNLGIVEECRRREMDLNILVDTGHLLISTLNMEELLERICVRLAWLTGMHSCSISFYHTSPKRLRLLGHYTGLGERLYIGENIEYLLENYPLISEALEHNNPQVIHFGQPQTAAAENRLLEEAGEEVLLALPLYAGGEPIGMLQLFSRQSDYSINPVELKRYHALSEQVALAITKSQHFQEEQRARLMAETLRKATNAITSSVELKEVLSLILEQFQQVVPFYSASLLLLENDEYQIMGVRGHPFPDQATAIRGYLKDDALSAQVIETKQPVILTDAQQDPRFLSLAGTSYVRGWMGVPLINRGAVIGMMTVDSRQVGAYGEAEAKLAETFAGHAAMAVTNARLFEKEQKHRAIAEALTKISFALHSSGHDSHALLDMLLEEIKQVVPYDTACVLLFDEGKVRITHHRGYENFGSINFDKFFLSLENTPNLRQMANTLRPYYIPDVKTDEGWIILESSLHVGSWVGSPLLGRERLLGFLSLDKVERNFYSEDHATSLSILAGHASLALLNSYAFKEVEEASVTDYLTNTYNHRHFQQCLREELSLAQTESEPLSLLMIDLDHFKQVNDTYGHQYGDQVLRILADRFKVELRSSDVLARYGGEEFAVILPTNIQNAEGVAVRLVERVHNHPFLIDKTLIRVTVSIGVAAYPDHAEDAQELINAADQALYKAKKAGRNQVFLAGECSE